jgi:VanZ family protein
VRLITIGTLPAAIFSPRTAIEILNMLTGYKMQRLFQFAAWLLALAIVILSLSPPSTRPVTGAGHNLEHLLIFLATGMAFALGYPRRFWLLPIALLAFAAAIEIAQVWVPGRHARLSDFLVDVTALYLGLLVSYLLAKLGVVSLQS